jgi:hypothetical protein
MRGRHDPYLIDDIESQDRQQHARIAIELATYAKYNYRRRLRCRIADEFYAAVQIAEAELFPERVLCRSCLERSRDDRAKRLAAAGYARTLVHLRRSLGLPVIAFEPLVEAGYEYGDAADDELLPASVPHQWLH